MRYREVGEGDHKDKGQHGGHCNTKACQSPDGVFWYNEATDSYYCKSCCDAINHWSRIDAKKEIVTFDIDGSKEKV